MAKEPDSLVLRLLREIRATQQAHGTKLDRMEKRVEDLYKISTHTLGVAANAHVRYEALRGAGRQADRADQAPGGEAMMHHLAQLNIARLAYPLDDPRVADFVNSLDRVNGIAERAEGFVWRLKDESGNATSIKGFDDPRVIVNMSVWESVELLEKFVWQTVHKRVYGRRTEWFERMDGPHFVMWWVPAGHRPSVAEAHARLELLAAQGPSEHAFGWESVPSAQLWRTARCA